MPPWFYPRAPGSCTATNKATGAHRTQAQARRHSCWSREAARADSPSERAPRSGTVVHEATGAH